MRHIRILRTFIFSNYNS